MLRLVQNHKLDNADADADAGYFSFCPFVVLLQTYVFLGLLQPYVFPAYSVVLWLIHS